MKKQPKAKCRLCGVALEVVDTFENNNFTIVRYKLCELDHSEIYA